MLDLSSKVGSLEKGKDASLVISEGDILDMKTSNVIQAFIMGEEIDLRNQQIELYEKYKKKFGID
jgi:imidazolonepropionase-like amidohydrolase